MAQQILGALTTLNLSTHLDPMFTELYAVRNLLTVSGSNIGFGKTPSVKWDVAGVIQADATNSSATFGSGGEFITVNNGSLTGSGGYGFKVNGTIGAAILAMGGGTAGTAAIAFGTASTSGSVVERMRISSAGVVTPGADNTQTLGSASLRWSVVYAGTGTINTSDAREKTLVRDLETAELDCAIALSKEVGSFKFLSAIKEKGDGARLHIGMTVQRAMEVMESFGLDPLRYAFICHDEWPAEHDEDGKETKPAGDRYGFRADELGLFIMRGLAARLDALEG